MEIEVWYQLEGAQKSQQENLDFLRWDHQILDFQFCNYQPSYEQEQDKFMLFPEIFF